jgi:hypothetical protein
MQRQSVSSLPAGYSGGEGNGAEHRGHIPASIIFTKSATASTAASVQGCQTGLHRSTQVLRPEGVRT